MNNLNHNYTQGRRTGHQRTVIGVFAAPVVEIPMIEGVKPVAPLTTSEFGTGKCDASEFGEPRAGATHTR